MNRHITSQYIQLQVNLGTTVKLIKLLFNVPINFSIVFHVSLGFHCIRIQLWKLNSNNGSSIFFENDKVTYFSFALRLFICRRQVSYRQYFSVRWHLCDKESFRHLRSIGWLFAVASWSFWRTMKHILCTFGCYLR